MLIRAIMEKLYCQKVKCEKWVWNSWEQLTVNLQMEKSWKWSSLGGEIKWLGTTREIAIGASQSDDVLLGTLLLVKCELGVNFEQGWVRIEQII